MNDDVVLHDRMTGRALRHRVALRRPASQGHALVEMHAVAHDRGLADHEAAAMVDEQSRPDGGGGMDVDPGPGAGHVRDDPGRQVGAEPVEHVAQPIVDQRRHARVAEQHLRRRGRRRVGFERRVQIQDQPRTDGGQFRREASRDRQGLGPDGLRRQAVVVADREAAADLLLEQAKGRRQRAADEVVEEGDAALRLAIVARKQRDRDVVHDVAQDRGRGHRADAAAVPDAVGHVPRPAQRRHDAVEVEARRNGLERLVRRIAVGMLRDQHRNGSGRLRADHRQKEHKVYRHFGRERRRHGHARHGPPPPLSRPERDRAGACPAGGHAPAQT